jgi:hypothetical protein
MADFNIRNRMTSKNRLAAMLEAQQTNAPPVTTHTQGLANMLRSGLAGYMRGQDAGDQRSAQQAMTNVMTQASGAHPSGKTVPTRQRLATALAGMQDNPYAADAASRMAFGQLDRDEAATDLTAQRAFDAGLLTDKRNYERGLVTDKNTLAAQLAATKRQQGVEDATTAFERDVLLRQMPKWEKTSPVKTVKTGEGMFILTPNGTLGNRLGSAKADTEIIIGGKLSKDFRPILDPKTGKQIGAEPVPGGKEDPATIQGKKEAERKAALNIENLKKLPARRSQIFASSQNAPAFEGAVNDAIKLAKSWSTSGLAQQALGDIAGTDAFALERALDTIKSNIGFGELLRIKEAGGTLGALSEMENRLLQAMQGALDPRLKGDKLVTKLELVQKIQRLNLEQKKREFKDMYPNSDKPWENLGDSSGATSTQVAPTQQQIIDEIKRRNNPTGSM